MDVLLKYFRHLSPEQRERFDKLKPLYDEWNAKINVISRKDMDHFYLHHVLHSLAIAKYRPFKSGERILDVGTGGGFPGVPLALCYPDTEFHLIDSIGKKVRVVKEVTAALKLKNVTAQQIRVEEVRGRYDYVVSRAVTALPAFYQWTRKNLKTVSRDGSKGSILYLKGSDYLKEMENLPLKYRAVAIHDYFEEDFFKEKFIVHIF